MAAPASPAAPLPTVALEIAAAAAATPGRALPTAAAAAPEDATPMATRRLAAAAAAAERPPEPRLRKVAVGPYLPSFEELSEEAAANPLPGPGCW